MRRAGERRGDARGVVSGHGRAEKGIAVATGWEFSALQSLENSQNGKRISILRELVSQAGGTPRADAGRAPHIGAPRPEPSLPPERARGAYATPSATLDRSARLRSLGSSTVLRRRIDFGVTSTSSSSWI